MKFKLLRLSLLSVLAMLCGVGVQAADFRDFGIDLRDASGGILTSDETSSSQAITFGIAVAENGNISRVAADAENAVAVISGKTGNNHGLQNFSATVPVSGAVQITMSTCSWGGDVTVKNAANETVTTFTTKKGEGGSGCYKGNGMSDENIISVKYVGEATTLTISGGAYVGYFAVSAVSASAATVSYSLGDVECEGTTIPVGGTYAIGDSYTIPANYTLYKEGYTLTGWTDGTTTYNIGASIALTGDLALTPVFTQNAVNLNDRTEAVTLNFPLNGTQGNFTINNSGIIVTQAAINGTAVDVKLAITAGTIATNNGGWHQVKNNFKATIPSCKGATVVISTYDDPTSLLTFGGIAEFNVAGEGHTWTATYTSATADETLEIAQTGSTYWNNLVITLPVVTAEPAQFVFRDFGIDLRDTKGGILTSDETSNAQTITFGISVAENGTISRVAADAGNAAAVITGKTGNNHGLQSFSATVPVTGPVKITMSTCSWGGNVTVKNAAGETITTFSTQKGEGGTGCYGGNGDDDANVISVTYAGEATTLTISGGAYVGWFSVKEVNASACNVTFSKGTVECEGTEVPADGQYAAGDKFTIPANYTLYIEGKTLTAWTDGTNEYKIGEEITLPSGDLTLTPVFTDNTVSLADRTEAVTVKWDLEPQANVPAISIGEGKTGFRVAQVIISDNTVDVKMSVDNTYDNGKGKLNNAGRGSWCQANANTKITIPSCKGATIAMKGYGAFTTTTIDGQNDYTSSTDLNYEVASSAENIDIIIGSDCGYLSFIQVTLPVVQQQGGGESFDNVAGTVAWAVGNEESGAASEEIASAISGATVSVGAGLTATETTYLSTKMIAYKPATSNAGAVESVMIEYRVKPKAGVTFKPTSVSYNAVKDGTDNATYKWSYTVDGTESDITEVSKDDIVRNNNTTGTPAMNHTETLTVDACSEFTFRIYVSGFGNSKKLGIGSVNINGVFNGTVQNIAQYTLTAVANPAEGGSINVYPAGGTYDEGTTIKLTATENFGYDFVNWTDADNQVVSENAVYSFDITKDETLTANFKQVETYELKLAVEGTNDYMVTVSPAPTVVDGKNMYEAGTQVTLTANQYEGLVTFNNWSDNSTSSELVVTMDDNQDITAVYSQADIIAGWDFYKAGNNGRVADFASDDNTAAALSLVKTADGTTAGWLDKSTEKGGGYESFKGAAVSWQSTPGTHHWQTKINAEAFKDIKVQFQMLYNYNAYPTYNAEYSLNGEEWTKFGDITMVGAKAVASFSGTLPAAANNQSDLYIRMIADKTKEVVGTAGNDGITLAMFFITGTQQAAYDEVAPALVSSVPANNATGASANGKIVLTFDKKVQIAEDAKATLNTQELTPAVSGKTITFQYKGLEYETAYTFTLPANSVKNLSDVVLEEAITINFTTMARPTVTKGEYDAVVATADELLAAITAANNRGDQNTRYRIFIKKGNYTIPLYGTTKSANGYDVKECITFITGKNISFIGENRDEVIITNGIDKNETFAGTYGTTSKYDGIGNSDVFQISNNASGLYWQDLTVETGMEDGTGRDIAIQDKGTKNIYKNVALRGYQDTWTSNNDNGLYYFEGGYLRGRTDFMCGKGDIYFNEVELRQIQGGYAAVPSKPAKIGWVFKGCTINGEASPAVKDDKGNIIPAEKVDGNYTLGRPWGKGTPTAYFIDTKMNVIPSAIGWSEMSGGFPKQFAEYNSTTKTGAVIGLSERKNTFDAYDEKKEVTNETTGEKETVYINRRNETNVPVLTAEEAATYSNKSLMFGDWDPTLATEQAPVPTNVKINGTKLAWDDSNYALLFAIVKDGQVIAFTTEAEYDVDDASAEYRVRAANEMGGMSEVSEVAIPGTVGINNVKTAVNNVNGEIYNLSGQRVNKATKGLYIVNGKKMILK